MTTKKMPRQREERRRPSQNVHQSRLAAVIVPAVLCAGACQLVLEFAPGSVSPPDGGPADATSATDATTDAALEDAPTDVAHEAPAPTIICGAESCPPVAQVCCVGRCAASAHCVANDGDANVCPASPADTCGFRVRRCDDPSDCEAGRICCGQEGTAACLSLSACLALTGHALHCDPTSPEPCPDAAPCELSGELGAKAYKCTGL